MMKVSEYDREHFWEILGDTKKYDHWTALFWRLYAKSDQQHRIGLALGFPDHAQVFEESYTKGYK